MSTRVSSPEARARIVDAAERLLRDRPYRELSVDALMTEAGLSRTVYYRHFEGLADVVLTLLMEITDDLADTLVAAAPEDLEAVLRAAVAAYARHGAFLQAIAQAAGHDAAIERAYRGLIDAFTATIAMQVEDGMTAGRTAPGNAFEVARAMNLMNIGYLTETLGRDPGFDQRVALDTLMAVWLPLTSHTS
jgi:AcrR family transcriptional regulator